MNKEEIKIGQKVKIDMGVNFNGSAGKVGTIVDIDPSDGDAVVYLGEWFNGHDGIKENNRHNMFVKPSLLTLVEDVQETTSKFKVGDIVTVVNNGKNYSTYSEFFKQNNCEELLENFKYSAPTNNFQYEVVFIGKHRCGWTLLVIQSPRTKQVYIIEEGGVELYSKPKKFKVGDKVKYGSYVGKIVYIDNDIVPYLVYLGENFCGHAGHGKSEQDNTHNWWVSECDLELIEEKPTIKKPTFKVGDKVRIRQWDDMKAEFGLTTYDSIACTFSFIKRMKHLCGKEFTITDIKSDGEVLGLNTDWSISTDMLEPVKPEPSKLVVGARVKVVKSEFDTFFDAGGKIGMYGTIVEVRKSRNDQNYTVYLGEEFNGHCGDNQDNRHNYYFKAEEIEVVKPILDDIEREYLSAVIKPFRNKISHIRKQSIGDNSAYIEFWIGDKDVAMLPSFKKSTGMYAGMKDNHDYSLEELDL